MFALLFICLAQPVQVKDPPPFIEGSFVPDPADADSNKDGADEQAAPDDPADDEQPAEQRGGAEQAQAFGESEVERSDPVSPQGQKTPDLAELMDEPDGPAEQTHPEGTLLIHAWGESSAWAVPLAATSVTAGAVLPAALGAGALVAFTAVGLVALASSVYPLSLLLVAVVVGLSVLPLFIGAGAGAGFLLAASDDTADDWISLGALMAGLVAAGVAIAGSIALIALIVMGGGGSLGGCGGCGDGCSGLDDPDVQALRPNSGLLVAVLSPLALAALGAAAGGAGALLWSFSVGQNTWIDDERTPWAVVAVAGSGLVIGATIGGALGGAGAALVAE